MGAFYDAIIYDFQYIPAAIVLTAMYMCLDNRTTKKIRTVDIIAIVILVVLSGMRYNVGSDYQEYFARYNHYISNWDMIGQRQFSEKLFYYCCYIFSLISQSEYGIFWMCALILYPPLVVIARKLTGRPSRVIGCFIFLELYAMSNNILRQFIAVEFVMFGYIAFEYNKKILGGILFILSIGFHTTAMFGILLIFIGRFIKPTIPNLRKSMLVGILAMFFWQPIMNILSLIPVVGRYSHYFGQQGKAIIRFGMVGYILFYILFIYWLIRYENKVTIKSTKLYNNVISFMILSIPLFFVAIQISYFHRIAVYLYSFSIFAIPDLYNVNLPREGKKIMRFNVAVMLILWLCYANIFSLDNTFWRYTFH